MKAKAFQIAQGAWRRRNLGSGLVIAGGVGVLIAFVTVLVYLTGGTRLVYAHSGYIPVVVAALFLGTWGGLGAGLAMGLALGPLMPVDVLTGEMQRLENWLFRMAFFSVVGVLTGAASDWMRADAQARERAALTDWMSGLLNRTALERRATTLSRERAGQDDWTLVLIRLNALRAAMEVVGLGLARQLWRRIVERVHEHLPAGAECYAAASDEIAILLPATGATDASVPAERLMRHLDEPILLGRIPVHLDPSVGIAPVHPRQSRIHGPLLSASESAALAWTTGRRVEQARQSTSALRLESLQRLGELPTAMRERQFALHLQPKIDLRSGRTVGAEALIRWCHPEHGMIPPGRFMPAVEQTGLIQSLTWHVVELACEEIVALREQGHDFPVAINISVRNLLAEELVPVLCEQLDNHGLVPSALELEVTEGAIMAAQDESCEALRTLADAGFALAIDDFGTGHSSLAYLARLPAQNLKIDRSFVMAMTQSDRDRAVLRLIVDTARALDMTTVAEGIEDEATLDHLRDLNCTQAQGYFIARPMPRRQLIDWLTQRDKASC